MDQKNNKVMVLGAGVGQVPLIDYLHKLGKYVIVVSPGGNYPGFALADDILYEDIRDRDKILDYAKKEQISAIVTDQLDQGVTTVAYVSDALNLNSNTFTTSLKFTDKYLMKEEARKLGVCVPKCIESETLESAITQIATMKLKFPLVIKPLDSSASNGIYKVSNLEMIKQHFSYTQSFSKSGKVIIEEFIDGKEYVVEAYTHDYVTNTLMVGHRDYFSLDEAFIPCATVFVDAESANSEIEQKLKLVNETLVKGFGLKFGITHGEYIVENETNNIYLVEIAARGGGVFISSELIPAVTGVKAIELLITDSLGEKIENIRTRKGAGAYFCYMLPEGIVCNIENTDLVTSFPGVIKCNFSNISLGMRIEKARDKYSRKGPIVVSAGTKDGCYSIISSVKKILNIQVVDNQGEVKNCYWN